MPAAHWGLNAARRHSPGKLLAHELAIYETILVEPDLREPILNQPVLKEPDLTETMSNEVASPCQNICQMNPQTGYCIGCLRTIDEIADWLEMTNQEKRALLTRLDERRKVEA